jgi:hypothetical protein
LKIFIEAWNSKNPAILLTLFLILEPWLRFTYLDIINTGLVYFSWFRGFVVALMQPTVPPFSVLLSPVVAVLIDWLVLYQTLSVWQLLGGCLILRAIVGVQFQNLNVHNNSRDSCLTRQARKTTVPIWTSSVEEQINLNFKELFNVQNKGDRPAHRHFDGLRQERFGLLGNGHTRRNKTGSRAAFVLHDLFGSLEVGFVDTQEQCGVAFAQKSACAGEFGDG